MAQQYTEAEIQRRKDLAKKLHAEGKFGGAQPGAGRPATRRRAAQQVAEALDRNIKDIVKTFEDGIKDGVPVRDRVATAEKWLNIERQEAELRLKEDRQLEDMSADQLIEVIVSRIARIRASGYDFDVVPDDLIHELEEGDDS